MTSVRDINALRVPGETDEHFRARVKSEGYPVSEIATGEELDRFAEIAAWGGGIRWVRDKATAEAIIGEKLQPAEIAVEAAAGAEWGEGVEEYKSAWAEIYADLDAKAPLHMFTAEDAREAWKKTIAEMQENGWLHATPEGPSSPPQQSIARVCGNCSNYQFLHLRCAKGGGRRDQNDECPTGEFRDAKDRS
jgi:hypothetical protein